MNFKLMLEKYFKLTEGVDFKMELDGSYSALPKKRTVDKPIHHPAIPQQLNAQGGVIANAVPEWYEMNMVEETYFDVLPTQSALIQRDGSESRRKCTAALNIVYSFNKLLNETQIEAMRSNTGLSTINNLLKDCWPSKALSLIQSLPVDGVMIKQEMKDMIIEVLSA